MKIDPQVPCSACNQHVQQGEVVIRPSATGLASLIGKKSIINELQPPHYWHIRRNNHDNFNNNCAFSLFEKLRELSSSNPISFDHHNPANNNKPKSNLTFMPSCYFKDGKLYSEEYLCNHNDADKYKKIKDALEFGSILDRRTNGIFKITEIRSKAS
jgi:hypothetical protein